MNFFLDYEKSKPSPANSVREMEIFDTKESIEDVNLEGKDMEIKQSAKAELKELPQGNKHDGNI